METDAADRPDESDLANQASLGSSFHFAIDRGSGTLSLELQVESAIKRAVAHGKLQPGSPLPPMMALAKQLNVGRITVERAYQSLQRAGLLVATVGNRGGTRIADVIPRAVIMDFAMEGLLRWLSYEALEHGLTTAEIDELFARAKERLCVRRAGDRRQNVVEVEEEQRIGNGRRADEERGGS